MQILFWKKLIYKKQNSKHSHHLAHIFHLENSGLQNTTPCLLVSLLTCSNINWQNTSISCQSIKDASGDLCCVGVKRSSMESREEEEERQEETVFLVYSLSLGSWVVSSTQMSLLDYSILTQWRSDVLTVLYYSTICKISLHCIYHKIGAYFALKIGWVEKTVNCFAFCVCYNFRTHM